jgi:beta-galactosidase
VLAVSQDGVAYPHGGRCHYSVASPTYRDYSKRIAAKLGERFGPNPHVIAWQIDNEYNRVSYDPETRRAFQEWLRNRYGDLDSLNRRYWTAYWSEAYTDWSQLPLPVFPSTENPWMVHNPGLRLDFKRFVGEQYTSFQRQQIEAIRPHARQGQLFTHNFMGWFDAFDHYLVAQDLDVAGFDNYIGEGHLDYAANGAAHDLTRGFKHRNHWVLETQASYTNHASINNSLDKGEIRSLVFHQVGHGADLVSYWQWRSALGGQEQYWGNVLHPDGTPRPHYAEIRQIGQELARIAPELEGTTPTPQVAILHSYEDRWAINFQRQHADFNPVAHLTSYYRPWREAGIDLDIVHPLAPLGSYRVVLAPHLHILSEDNARHLRAFVEAGGHLVLGTRSGLKDPDNALLPSRQPGLLADLTGVRVEQFYPLQDPIGLDGPIGASAAHTWAEWLAPFSEGVEVLANYGTSNGWLDGQAAVTTRKVGEGRVTMVGAWLDEVSMTALTAWLREASGIQSPLPAPSDVEICCRSGNGRRLILVINHSREAREVQLPWQAQDLLNGESLEGQVSLGPRGVRVLSVPQGGSGS